MINREGQVVGVLFDGNQFSIVSPYFCMPPELGARSIGVHSAGVIEALRKIYGAEDLVKELLGSGRDAKLMDK